MITAWLDSPVFRISGSPLEIITIASNKTVYRSVYAKRSRDRFILQGTFKPKEMKKISFQYRRCSLRQTGPGSRGVVEPEREVPVPSVREGRRRDERDGKVAVADRCQEVSQYLKQARQVSNTSFFRQSYLTYVLSCSASMCFVSFCSASHTLSFPLLSRANGHTALA